LGGICLNWGCIPTKALLKSAQVFDYLKHASDYGLTVKEFDKDFSAVVKRSRDVADGMSKGVQFLMKKNKIDVIDGFGKVKPGKKVDVTAADGVDWVFPPTDAKNLELKKFFFAGITGADFFHERADLFFYRIFYFFRHCFTPFLMIEGSNATAPGSGSRTHLTKKNPFQQNFCRKGHHYPLLRAAHSLCAQRRNYSTKSPVANPVLTLPGSYSSLLFPVEMRRITRPGRSRCLASPISY
jgi:hypothetical protein